MPNEKFDQPSLKVEQDGSIDRTPESRESAPMQFPAALADKYEYISLIGRGGMASVFKGRHKLTGRVDAIKVLQKQEDPQHVQRFQREATAIAKLSDPNIVSMHDFGIADDVAYLVMEYVAGESLSEMLHRQGAFNAATFTDIFDQIASGLEHAHQNGIVHRDLKPSNILVTKHNGRYVAKIADFGIAKLLDAEPGVDLTHTGETIGTPLYMSPEQSMGQQANALSDMYSLGCIMYESLTLVPPIAGQNMLDVAHRRLNENPKSLADHGVKVSPEIELVVTRCLERDPDKRLTASEVRTAIHGGKVSAKQSNRPIEAEQTKRFRIGTAVFTVVLLGYVCWLVPMFEKNNNAMMKISQDSIYPLSDNSKTPVVRGMNKINFRADIERGPAGRVEKSMPFYDATSGMTGVEFKTLQSDARVATGISGWKQWYQNIFNKLTYGVHVPKSVRSKIQVTVTKSRQVTANIEWEDPTKDPLSEVFTQNLLSQVMRLNGNQILQFPENVDAVKFDVYAQGSDDSLRVTSDGHPLTNSR